jgi:hypothetical protein
VLVVTLNHGALILQDALWAARKHQQRRQHKGRMGTRASGSSSAAPHIVSGGISKRSTDIRTAVERIAQLRLGI